MFESLQVFDEVIGVTLVKPFREFVRIGRGEGGVAVFVGQLENRFDAHAAVEVVVQHGLGEGDEIGSLHRRRLVTWCMLYPVRKGAAVDSAARSGTPVTDS